MSTVWLTLDQTSNETRLIEHKVAYSAITSTPPGRPTFVALFGARAKSVMLHQLCSTPQPLNPHGQIRLQVEPKSRGSAQPIVFIDCEMHRSPFLQQSSLSVSDGERILHRLPWAGTTNSAEARAERQNLTRAICARVLAPFVGIFCYFAADLAGLKEVSATIAQQVIAYSAPNVPRTALPTLHVIASSKRDCHDDTQKLLRLILAVLVERGSYGTREDARSDLFRHFRSISVVNHVQGIVSSQESQTMGDYLSLRIAEVERSRKRSRMLFEHIHLQSLMEAALRDLANDSRDSFRPLLASRAQNMPSNELPSHLIHFLHIIKDDREIFMHGVPIIASALMLDSCPPGMHYFDPNEVFVEFYHRHCLSAICSVTPYDRIRDPFMEAVEAEFEVLCSTIEPCVCTAKQSHMATMKKSWQWFNDKKSHKTCYACLMRMPEKVLSCGHALCDVCIQIFGSRSSSERYSYVLPQCILCGARNHLPIFQLMPPTAGVRLLSLDGGGVRAVIPLVLLHAIERQLEDFLCPLRDYFDLVSGTSSGGLIILGLFFKNWTPAECLEKFKRLARKLFTKQWSDMTIFGKIHNTIRSYLADCQYDSNDVEKSIKEAFGPDVLMFNPLTTDTKVAITATDARDTLPYLFTNYNGGKRASKPNYTVVRAEDPQTEPTRNDVARCTIAAPWYIKPKGLDKLGTFQDGGLWLNNPLPVCVWELNELYSGKGDPDFALSVGTGSPIKPSTGLGSGCYAPAKDRCASRLVRAFLLSLEGQKTWDEFTNTLPPSSRARHYRLNVMLEKHHLTIDNVGVMEDLEHRAVEYASTGVHVKDVRDAILASMFYFEFDSLPYYVDGRMSCSGNIFCRLTMPARGRKALYDELRRMSAFFLVDGKPIPCIETMPKCCPPFKRRVKFSLQDLGESVGITLRNATMRPRFISGLPKSAHELIEAQGLGNVFGRKNHEADKELPPIPRKRKARFSDAS